MRLILSIITFTTSAIIGYLGCAFWVSTQSDSPDNSYTKTEENISVPAQVTPTQTTSSQATNTQSNTPIVSPEPENTKKIIQPTIQTKAEEKQKETTRKNITTTPPPNSSTTDNSTLPTKRISSNAEYTKNADEALQDTMEKLFGDGKKSAPSPSPRPREADKSDDEIFNTINKLLN